MESYWHSWLKLSVSQLEHLSLHYMLRGRHLINRRLGALAGDDDHRSPGLVGWNDDDVRRGDHPTEGVLVPVLTRSLSLSPRILLQRARADLKCSPIVQKLQSIWVEDCHRLKVLMRNILVALNMKRSALRLRIYAD